MRAPAFDDSMSRQHKRQEVVFAGSTFGGQPKGKGRRNPSYLIDGAVCGIWKASRRSMTLPLLRLRPNVVPPSFLVKRT